MGWLDKPPVVNVAAAAAEQIISFQHYGVFAGKAVSIADMCIMPSEFERRLSDCGQYCPVSLADSELVDCSSYNRLTFAAEFRGNLKPMTDER